MENENTNNTVWNEPFFMFRKVSKCYANSISFLSDKFLKIIKLALPVILLSSLGMTAIFYVICDAGLEMALASTLGFISLSVLVAFLSLSLDIAFLYRCIDINIEGLNIYSVGYKYVYNKVFIQKFLKVSIVNAIAFLILGMLLLGFYYADSLIMPDAESPDAIEQILIKTWLLRLGFCIILVTLLLPLYVSLNKFMFEKNGGLSNLWYGYKLGWKKWGKIFALDLLVTITISILIAFTMAPAYVISLMQHSATLSRLQGDAVEIPTYFPYITAIILFISSAFMTILTMFKFLPQAYIYASFSAHAHSITDK